MTQAERRIYLIQYLLCERAWYRNREIPQSEDEQRRLLRSLLNVRPPQPIGEDFLTVQDAYLKERANEKGMVGLPETSHCGDNLYLWRGDITRLAVDAVVNAANRGMTGCYCPCHGCVDNCIHTFSGVELRLECAELMKKQGYDEPAGRAKITKAYNLPSRYIIHTVGPAVAGRVTQNDEKLLAGCYRSCLELAKEGRIKSIAFCCISTGEFHFPSRRAAELAVRTVRAWSKENQSEIKVIFNVFKNEDDETYRELLGADI